MKWGFSSKPKDPFTDCLDSCVPPKTYLENQNLGNGAKESSSLTFLYLACDTYFEKAQKTQVFASLAIAKPLGSQLIFSTLPGINSHTCYRHANVLLWVLPQPC